MKLPKVAVWSIFRDSSGEYLKKYRQRIEALDYPIQRIRLYLAEGDSTDDTWNEIIDWQMQGSQYVKAVKCDSGLPREWHTVSPERFKSLSLVNNAAINLIVEDNWADVAVLIESDLLYEPDLLRRLLSHRPATNAIIAPMIWYPTVEPPSKRFYDIWAYRWTAEQNFPFDLSWYEQNIPADTPFQVESVGSIVVFPMAALKAGCRYDGEVIRGMCVQAGELGYPVYVDPTTHVWHPPHEGER